jgi:hypothetical protein
MLPAASLPGSGSGDFAGAPSAAEAPTGGRVSVRLQIRIPRRDRRAHDRHPATISPLTQSVGIATNGGAQQVFNATPSSPNCSVGTAGTTCTFAVDAKVGADSFVVTTYSSVGGGGIVLDRGTAKVPVKKGKANAIVVRLGVMVSTTADNGVGSLRYAVATANFGDTIMFLLPSGSTIALASPIVINGSVVIAGPGAAAPVAISGGNAHQIFLVVGSATISGLTFKAGKAPVSSTPGGAIANTGALALVDDTFGSNTSAAVVRRAHRAPSAFDILRHPHCSTTFAQGGALYNVGTLVMSGNTFIGNVVSSDAATCVEGQGGAIYNDQLGSMSSSGDTFTNNSAMQGGAVYNAGVGQVSFTKDTFSGNTGCTAISGCPTSGCISTGCTSFAQGTGAAILDAGGVTITSSTFTNNVAGGATDGSTGEGGALALGAGNPTITGSTFSGNLAGGGTASCSLGQGGAIYAAVPVVLTNDSFTGNRAVGDATSIGGAIVDTTTVEASGSTFKSNQAIGSGSACIATSQAGGGAIYAVVSATLNGNNFTSNTASASQTASAGAVGCTACSLTGNTFTSNAAIGTGAAGATGVTAAGGALFGQAEVKLVGNTFTSNSTTIVGPNATEAYGGAAVVITGPLSSSGNTFTSNSAKQATGTGVVAGGAIVVATGVALMSHDTFTSNTVTGSGIAGGGAGYFAGELVLNSATVSHNHATGGTQAFGGGVATGPGAEFNHDAISQNTVTATAGVGAGGGLYDENGGQVENTTVTQNTASGAGGGIIAGPGELLIDVRITGNAVTAAKATDEGGGGVFASGATEIEQSTIANNSVTVSGAGSSGGGGIYSADALTASFATISGNVVLGSAPKSGGGGIYSGAAVSLQNATISNNTSKDDGGGMYVGANATVAIQNVTLFKNAATGTGGNVINPFAITLTNSIVAGGSAASGADVSNTGTLTSGDYNIIQTAITGNAPTGTTTHDKTANPLLLALSNNGGATFTNADGPSSPGKAYIPYAGGSCGSLTLATDQRNYDRGAGGHCDVGAFEYGGVPSAVRHRMPRRPAASSARGPHLWSIRLHPIRTIGLPIGR